MNRLADETEYVLVILHQMRAEVIARPQLFDPDALKRIDEAISLIENGKEMKAA